MELWLWGVSGFMWFAAVGLIGVGIWKLLHARKLLRGAALTVYAKALEKHKQSLLQMQKRLKAHGQRLSSLPITENREKLISDHDKVCADVEQTLDKVFVDLGVAEFWGAESGRTSAEGRQMRELWATDEIALAASFFAIAGVLLGISAVLIAVFMNI